LAKQAKRKKVQAVESDYGPTHATQASHGPIDIDYVAEDGVEDRNRVRRHMTPPLEFYRGKKILTNDQFTAGAALRLLYVKANAEASLIPQYAERIGTGSVQAAYTSKRRIMAKYSQALWYCTPMYAAAVRTACCEELFLYAKADRVKLVRGLDKLLVWFERGARNRPIGKP